MRFRFYAVKLSLLIVIVFLFQIFISGFTDFFLLNSKVWYGEYWRFISSIFLHAGIAHLIYNLFALILFGSILESLIGEKKFLAIFFITGILANFISVNFYSASLGASGAIFGVIGTLVVIRPLLIVWAFGLPMPIFIAGILWGIGDLIGAVGFIIGNPIDNTGNIAHLSGMLFGLLLGLFYRDKKMKKNSKNKIKINENYLRKWEERYMS